MAEGVMRYEAECLKLYLNCSISFGESLHYDETTHVLSFVDYYNKVFHSVDLDKGPSSHTYTGTLEHAAHKLIELTNDHERWLISSKSVGIGLMDKKTGKNRRILQAPLKGVEPSKMLFNDGAVDSRGRFWIGAFADPFDIASKDGRLWRIDPDLSASEVLGTGLGVPNGLGWSPDEKTMYFSDTTRPAILAYDFDVARGSVSNERVFWEASSPGPDGLAVDADGCVWAALLYHSKVVKISPQGSVLAEVSVPTALVTDVAFAGEDLYITTAHSEEKPEGSGDIYRCHVGVRGRKLFKFPLSKEFLASQEARV